LPPESRDIELHIQGIVQGVGFRPFVYRLAREFSITGSVANTANGVVIQLSSPGGKLADFIWALREKAPAMAQITAIDQRPCRIAASKSFIIRESQTGCGSHGVIPPDTSICPDCRRELFDPDDRRYHYPFINCTNCGPRFTIISQIPYDRPYTSMHNFKMCDPCLTEYQNPESRRFHAEPNACADCGPSLSWHKDNGEHLPVAKPIMQAAAALKKGKIVAMRGLGGFHLVVDAENAAAVENLRHRKGRPSKPLAVMVADLTALRRYCRITAAEEDLLDSPERPIMLLRKKEGTALAMNLAPGIMELGCMLPYTPLHYLLFAVPDAPAALVMTSGNRSGMPICTSNEQALAQLSGIADFFLLHNREILTRADDSVGRYMAGTYHIFRRSRGYVPQACKLSRHLPEIIACGAELKNTFCLTRGDNAFLSQHIGDLHSAANLDFYVESIEHLKKLLNITPVAAVCDEHPDYQSSRYAQALGLPLIKVQHHHAHAAAVMAEHGLHKCLAVVMDGMGWGPDHTVWGGEVLLADLEGYKRLGHLQTLPMPGGDRAAREGWRLGLAAAWLTGLAGHDLPPALRAIPISKQQIINDMLAKGINSPLTSSAGRLFDTVASLLGVRQNSEYEGQAAMELEGLALQAMAGQPITKYLLAGACLPVKIARDKKIIQTVPMLQKMLELAHYDKPERLALHFHIWLCYSVLALLKEIRPTPAVPLVLAGGCMQNNLLFTGLSTLLGQQNKIIYSGEKIPANDGGLALGQAVIGGCVSAP